MSISTLSIDKNYDENASKTTEDLYHLQKKCVRVFTIAATARQ